MALKPCRECGEQISSVATVCPKCGKNYPTTTVSAGTVLGGICAAAMIGVAFGYLHDIHTPMQASAAPVANIQMPADEATLIAAVLLARDQYNAGANDMAKGAARPARAKTLCALGETGARFAPQLGFNSSVKDWVGKVVTLTTNNDGKGVLGLEIADDVQLKTWNNDVSDAFDQTLIEPTSALFPVAVGLHADQHVKFSGSLFRKSSSDCFEESSVTLVGSMTQPEFIFRFTSIVPLD
jgi:RNA polymerase subunit RPABC4/transcription elongation factor Spt4